MVDRRCGGAGCGRALAGLMVLACLPSSQVWAQTQTAGGFERLGIRTETWNLFPSLSFTTLYDDNVFALPEGDERLESDVSFILSPRLTAEANTRRHALAVQAGASIGRFIEQSDQDFNDFDLGVSGRWDVDRTLAITAGFDFAQTREDQADPDRRIDERFRTETTTINTFNGNVAARKDWQRLFARARAGVNRRVFDELNATALVVGRPGPPREVNINADRDRTRVPLNFRLGYDFDRSYNGFVNVGYTLVRFDEPELNLAQLTPDLLLVSEGDEQDFESLSVRVGSGVDFDQLVSGDFAVGLERRFGNQEGDDLGFSFDADLDWTLSPRSSLGVSGSQGFEPASGGDAGGSSLVTRLGLDLSYALTRQFSVAGNVDYRRDDRGGGGRTDDDITTGVSASYAINRYASLSASYQYRQRNSTDADREFERNRVFLTVTGRY